MEQDITEANGLPAGRLPTDLGSCVADLVNTLARGASGILAPLGFLPLEFAVLRLFLAREQWTVTLLAQTLPVQAPQISRVVTGLVNRGLLQRRRLRSDRRVVFLTLTDGGKTLTLELYRRVQDYEAMLSHDVSEDEMAAFASVASKVVANYSALAASASSGNGGTAMPGSEVGLRDRPFELRAGTTGPFTPGQGA